MKPGLAHRARCHRLRSPRLGAGSSGDGDCGVPHAPGLVREACNWLNCEPFRQLGREWQLYVTQCMIFRTPPLTEHVLFGLHGACRPDLYLAGYVVAVGGLLVFAVVGIALLIVRQKAKDKHTQSAVDAESQEVNGRVRQNNASHAAVAWILFAVLLLGALLCAIAVGVDTTRDS